MCGIFAFTGREPDRALLEQAALGAGRRGPHGWGWAARNDDRPLVAHHYTVPLADSLDIVGDLSATAILGHARLATVGDWRQHDQLQPIVVAGYALAHNGVIRNADQLDPGHATDSIALAHAYARERTAGRHPYEALDKLVATAEHEAWAIVVLDTNGALYANRHYHPLYLHKSRGGVYLSSHRLTTGDEALPPDQTIRIQ